MKKETVYNVCMTEVMKLGIKDGYHSVFLGTMVLRRIRHPEESIHEIATKVMDTMPVRYGNQDMSESNPSEQQMRDISMNAIEKSKASYGKVEIIKVSREKALNELEEALANASDIPDCWIEGWIVSNVVNNLVTLVFKELDKKHDYTE